MISFTLEPAFVCRVAGEPVSRLHELRSARLTALLRERSKLREALQSSRDEVSALLHRAVGDAERSDRSSLVRLRRALFNRRDVAQSDIDAGLQALSGETAVHVSAAISLLGNLLEVDRTIDTVYTIERSALSAGLWTIVATSDVVNGLCLSSETLTEHAIRSQPERLSGARRAQVERGFLRYLTRAAAKPTPFSTFCSVIAGRFERSASEHDVDAGARLCGSLEKRSAVRLNRALFPVVWRQLSAIRSVRSALTVRPARSLRRDGDDLWIVRESAGVEVVTRLRADPAIDWILDTTAYEHAPVAFSDLVRELGLASDGDRAAEAYLERLLEHGVLHLEHGVGPLDPDWDVAMRHALPTEEPTCATVQAHLERLRGEAEGYARLSAGERLESVRRAREHVASLTSELGVKIRLPSNLPFYEDCGASATCRAAEREGRPEYAASLERLQEALHALSPQWDEQATLRAVFEQCYGERREGVPVLQFYEDAFRAFYKRHFALERSGIREEADKGYDLANPLGLASIARRRDARNALIAMVRARIDSSAGAHVVSLSTDAITEAIQASQTAYPAASISAFAQLACLEDGSSRLILPEAKVLLGFGKYFSRFLHLMPAEFTDGVRARNEHDAVLLAEIADESDFNANLHPPLSDFEIRYPTRNAVSTAEQAIDCSEILVEPADGFEGLVLRRGPAGPLILPLDLGFQNPSMRPAFHRLLQRFQPPAFSWLPIESVLYSRATEAWNAARASDPNALLDIAFTPRIEIDGAIVIARRRWRIPPDAFPSPDPGESDARYFVRLQDWREAIGLPERVFARVLPCAVPAKQREAVTKRAPDAGSRAARRLFRDNRKPQYIDFLSPHLADLFGRLRSHGQQLDVVVEEALPDLDDAVPSGDGSHMIELILQLSASAPVAFAAAASNG